MRKVFGVFFAALLSFVLSVWVPAVAQAAATPIVVTDVTDQIASTLTPIGLIGAGVLLVIVGIKTYKWVRRAM